MLSATAWMVAAWTALYDCFSPAPAQASVPHCASSKSLEVVDNDEQQQSVRAFAFALSTHCSVRAKAMIGYLTSYILITCTSYVLLLTSYFLLLTSYTSARAPTKKAI